MIGRTLHIISIIGSPEYDDAFGSITDITDNGMLRGTWGDIEINPWVDEFEVLEDG